ncbi:unnamed protein product [Closterium sp. Naga37s-1]|nr:unnamed protein product [Closterium sp. Naga37s-1]
MTFFHSSSGVLGIIALGGGDNGGRLVATVSHGVARRSCAPPACRSFPVRATLRGPRYRKSYQRIPSRRGTGSIPVPLTPNTRDAPIRRALLLLAVVAAFVAAGLLASYARSPAQLPGARIPAQQPKARSSAQLPGARIPAQQPKARSSAQQPGGLLAAGAPRLARAQPGAAAGGAEGGNGRRREKIRKRASVGTWAVLQRHQHDEVREGTREGSVQLQLGAETHAIAFIKRTQERGDDEHGHQPVVLMEWEWESDVMPMRKLPLLYPPGFRPPPFIPPQPATDNPDGAFSGSIRLVGVGGTSCPTPFHHPPPSSQWSAWSILRLALPRGSGMSLVGVERHDHGQVPHSPLCVLLSPFAPPPRQQPISPDGSFLGSIRLVGRHAHPMPFPSSVSPRPSRQPIIFLEHFQARFGSWEWDVIPMRKSPIGPRTEKLAVWRNVFLVVRAPEEGQYGFMLCDKEHMQLAIWRNVLLVVRAPEEGQYGFMLCDKEHKQVNGGAWESGMSGMWERGTNQDNITFVPNDAFTRLKPGTTSPSSPTMPSPASNQDNITFDPEFLFPNDAFTRLATRHG